jgi:hypothetical protein
VLLVISILWGHYENAFSPDGGSRLGLHLQKFSLSRGPQCLASH